MQSGSIVHYNGKDKLRLLWEAFITKSPIPIEGTDYMVTDLEPKETGEGKIFDFLRLDSFPSVWYAAYLFDEVVPPFPIEIEETQLETA